MKSKLSLPRYGLWTFKQRFSARIASRVLLEFGYRFTFDFNAVETEKPSTIRIRLQVNWPPSSSIAKIAKEAEVLYVSDRVGESYIEVMEVGLNEQEIGSEEVKKVEIDLENDLQGVKKGIDEGLKFLL